MKEAEEGDRLYWIEDEADHIFIRYDTESQTKL